MRPGRHSGILVPQFGINDLIRPSGGYNRQVTNIGYYWAPNDYIDLTARLDWFANRYSSTASAGQYRWLNRFMTGSAGVNQQREVGGSTGLAVRWDHRQTFDLSTSLNLELQLRQQHDGAPATTRIDPLQNTQQITSSLNFSKRYGWGTSPGRQPAAETSPRERPAAAPGGHAVAGADRDRRGHHLVAGPQLHQQHQLRDTGRTLLQVSSAGGLDTIALTGDSRVTAFNFDTPIRLGVVQLVELAPGDRRRRPRAGTR